MIVLTSYGNSANIWNNMDHAQYGAGTFLVMAAERKQGMTAAMPTPADAVTCSFQGCTSVVRHKKHPPLELHQAAVEFRVEGLEIIKERVSALQLGHKEGRQGCIQQDALVQGLAKDGAQEVQQRGR